MSKRQPSRSESGVVELFSYSGIYGSEDSSSSMLSEKRLDSIMVTCIAVESGLASYQRLDVGRTIREGKGKFSIASFEPGERRIRRDGIGIFGEFIAIFVEDNVSLDEITGYPFSFR